MPDLTAAGAITALKADNLLQEPQYSPRYGESYNLGPTGLRGWIYIDRNNMGNDGLQTAQSRQILVTVASTPGSPTLAVDDVILGVKAGGGADLSYPADAFASDCRKAFGWAICDAETAVNAGVIRVLRWRAGTINSVAITLPANVRASYANTSPYLCDKSTQILANARSLLVSQLLADPNFLSTNYGGAITGLALLAGVPAGVTQAEQDTYAAVQTRLRAFAQALAPANLTLTGCDTWNWGYIGIFLSEYYLRTVADNSPDNSVLHGINEYTVGLAKGQSKYGTFGHGGAEKHADGSLHGSISWYGPVNSAGIPANVAIVMGKKALQLAIAAGAPGAPAAMDPEIDPAIERGSNFFGWFVNKGAIPYGEHEPYGDGHASNGKDEMCAVLFGLQGKRSVEAEFFARMSVAGCTGREYGHTGQGFSYLWGAMGANMGGITAVAEYLKTIRWHLDLERRTDGSFVYDGGEQYGGGTTTGSTYLGACGYNAVNPTASYILTYALPLQRLYITGKNLAVAPLTSDKVANAIAASTFKQDCTNQTAYPVSRLMAALSEYDPAMRSNAATELARRTLTTGEVASLIVMAEGSNTNARMGACETLGALKDTRALPVLARRLDKTLEPEPWVRGKASNALKNFGSAASEQLAPMLTAMAANATDPEVIVWDDPIQIANGYLAKTLFQDLSGTTNALSGTARTTLLYPALRAGLKQPDGMARMYLGGFIENNLTLDDVKAVAPSLVAAAARRSPADRMFSDVIRYNALKTLAKYKIEEGIPLCLEVKEQTWHGDDWAPFDLLSTAYRGAAKDALPTLYKWQEHIPQFTADGSIGGCCPGRLPNIINHIASTIAAIENDASPPTLTRFKTLTPSANPPVVTLPTISTILNPGLVDLDAGTPNFLWSKVSGPGSVALNPSGLGANATCTATFNTPGTYVLRVTAVDRSILDYNTWITYSLGYFDFQTYNEILGAATANLSVTVAPDTNRAPRPQNQSLVTPLNTALTITLVAADPDGNAMTYSIVTPPAHGILTGTAPNVSYTPTPGYTGADSFTFKADDGKVDSMVATIAIDVGAAGNRRPLAVNQSVTTAEDTLTTITLSGSDPNGDALTYAIVSEPVHGVLIGIAPNLTYLPAANFPAGNTNGSDSFTFTVRDALLTSAPATVSITVVPVNDPPQALAQSLSVSTLSINPITLAGVDPENYALSYAVVSNPSHGMLGGTAPHLSYTPAANYHGTDSFTFQVTDSEGLVSAAAILSITVINDPPVANPQVAELQPNTNNKGVTLTGSDNCNDTLTYTVLSQPAHGTLSGTAPNLTYTPAADYTGADSFTFKVNDGVNDSATAAVTLNVVQWQTWTNIASGNWSIGGKWSGGVAPTAGGSSTGVLVFSTSSYSGTSSNDLTGSFQLNRLSLGSSLPALTLGGKELSFALNSAILPQVNLAGNKAVAMANDLTLSANTTLGGTGTGAVTLSGIIAGAGGLTKATSGALTLSGVNTYAGGTIVSSGILSLATGNARLGTGALTMSDGSTFKVAADPAITISNTLVLTGGFVTLPINFGGGTDITLGGPITGSGGLKVINDGNGRRLELPNASTFGGGVLLSMDGGGNQMRVRIGNANALGTGTLRCELASGSGGLENTATLTTGLGVPNAIDIASGASLNVGNNSTLDMLLSGAISGAGNLTKMGSATLTLSGGNTYTGTTTVSTGILACASAASLGQGPLVISSGAKVNLNFTGTRRVVALSLNGGSLSNGTYGASNQGTYFTGAGTVTVAPATSSALALTSGASPSSLGDSLTFTATVAGSTPTGNVAFYAGATLLGTSALNAAFQASVTTSSLTAGSNNISAQYAGNLNNGASTSAVLTIQVIGPAVPPTNLAATAGNNTVGLTWSAADTASGYYVKRASVSGGAYTPLGTAGGTSYTDATAVNGITYYYVVSSSNIAGEGVNSGQASATPAPPLPSTTTLASSLGTTGAYGATVTFTATVAVTGGPATGTVIFKDGSTVLGTATLGSGQASCVTNTLAAGTHSITATYGGSLAFEASTSGAWGYTVSKKSVTITGVTAASKTYDGSTAATLTGGTVNGVINGDAVTVAAGTGSFASAAAGTWPVTAIGYAPGGAGAGNYVLSVQPAVPDATITVVTGAMFALTNLNISATATGVEILHTGALVEANHFFGTNAAVTLANGLTFGTDWSHTSPAGWSGGQNTNHDAQGIVPLLTDATAFGKLMRNYTWSSSDTHTLTIPGLVPGHTYRLQLISVAGKNAGVVVEASPSATWTDSYNGTPSLLTAIWVQSAGDTVLNVALTRNHSFSGAHDNELEANGYALHDITPPAPPAAPSNLVATPDNNVVSLTWNAVSGATAYYVKRSTVSGGGYTTIEVPSVASYQDTQVTKGITYYYAVSALNGGGEGPNSGQVSAMFAGLSSVSALASSSGATGIYGTAVTFTATVTATATGTVTFYDGATMLGTATLNGSGMATYATSTFAAVGHSITAAYGGNATFASSASGAFAYAVSPKPLTVSGITASNKIYDTGTGATLNAGSAALVGNLDGGNVVLGTAAAIGTFTPDGNVGSGKTVQVSDLTLSGAASNNYTIVQPKVPANITPATASVTLGSLTHTYDGAAQAATATTIPAGLTVDLTYDGGAGAPHDVGTYVVRATVNEMNYVGSATGTLVIAAETIITWRASRFIAKEIADGLAADGADPDGDGFTNLAEYVLGTDPRSADPQPLALTRAADNTFTLSFLARSASGSGYAGLTRKYDVECSSELGTTAAWQGAPGYTGIVGGGQTVNVALPIAAPQKFYRLNVRVE
ncbi:MAG: DUF6288 domain-containing protein [Verrucomicrobiota bacterium]